MCVVTDYFSYNDRTLGVVCVRGIGSQEPNAGSMPWQHVGSMSCAFHAYSIHELSQQMND
jgi:hypothetical protein